MRKRIQRSMMLILAVTLVLFYAIMSVILYNRNLNLLKSEVKQEAEYIRTAVNISGPSYLDQMSQADERTRITQIDENGDVLYDSSSEESDMENHGAREEIKEALASGTGESERVSDTLGRELYYYAVLLDDGTVLRVAKSMDNLAMTALNVLPVMGVLAVIMIGFALMLAKWQTQKLIKPINELNLETPLENTIYEELTPLLVAMDKQNKEKEAVSISGYAEIMKNGMVRPADIPVFSERIYKEARRLITLVEDIIKLSKLDEESVELEKEEVDLYDLTMEIVSRLSPQASQKHIRMEVTGEQVNCFGIRQILDEMVYNVCENAIKYNNEGGRVSVWVGATLDGPKISVSDTGIGIPKEHQERIFERFYRVDKSHSKERGGTGLGLSIVKHGALLHGAKVSVDSAPGKGTRIEMLFPKDKE